MSLVEEEGLAEEQEAAEEEDLKEGEDSAEEEVPMPKKKSRVGTSHSSTRPSMGPIFEVSIVTEDDIARI